MLEISYNICFLRLMFSCSSFCFQDPQVYFLTKPYFWQFQLLTEAVNALIVKNKPFPFYTILLTYLCLITRNVFHLIYPLPDYFSVTSPGNNPDIFREALTNVLH